MIVNRDEHGWLLQAAACLQLNRSLKVLTAKIDRINPVWHGGCRACKLWFTLRAVRTLGAGGTITPQIVAGIKVKPSKGISLKLKNHHQIFRPSYGPNFALSQSLPYLLEYKIHSWMDQEPPFHTRTKTIWRGFQVHHFLVNKINFVKIVSCMY